MPHILDLLITLDLNTCIWPISHICFISTLILFRSNAIKREKILAFPVFPYVQIMFYERILLVSNV
jgi:hypothetical protein